MESYGILVKNDKIIIDPEIIFIIKNYKIPKTLVQLRAFIKLIGCYKKFIRDFAKIMRPLAFYLTTKNLNKQQKINLDSTALIFFKRLKNLFQEQIELYQPNFDKPFELINEENDFSLGAILSQNTNPIIFISRILNPRELTYTKDEKEILNIIWALHKLRSYAKNGVKLTIYTNFPNLKQWISEESPNFKMEKWRKALIKVSIPI